MIRFSFHSEMESRTAMLKEQRPVLDPYDPFVAISSDTTHVFKTGNQRSERPVFLNKVAPCRHACPIGIDIPLAIHRASEGDQDSALGVYLQDNPLPGVCGRVCYHPCEVDCSRGQFDESLNIKGFERFLSDHAKHDVTRDIALRSKAEKIAVVGSGPGGLSASYHLARMGYTVTLFEAKPELGGMLRYGIPPYRLPRSVLDREIERILSLGIETRLNTFIGKDPAWEALDVFDAVFVSIGLQKGTHLPGLEGPEFRLLTGLDFLADPQRWSLEDDTLKTLIVGGGNVAIDVARTLLRLRKGKGENISVVCPESRERMPALPEEIKEALEEGIGILNGWAPHGLHRKMGDITSLDLHRATVEVDGMTGEVKIISVGDEIKTLPAERVIMAIGQGLHMEALPEDLSIDGGRIVTDAKHATTLPSVFAGGDAVGEKAFVADAIASGKKGALAIHCHLEKTDLDTIFKAHRIGQSRTFAFQHFMEKPHNGFLDLTNVVPYEKLNVLFFSKSERRHVATLDREARKKSFDEVAPGLDQPGIDEEISRCFRCGTCIDCENCLDFCPDISIIKDRKAGKYAFDPDFCKGCGVCSVACPRDIIEMKREAQ